MYVFDYLESERDSVKADVRDVSIRSAILSYTHALFLLQSAFTVQLQIFQWNINVETHIRKIGGTVVRGGYV